MTSSVSVHSKVQNENNVGVSLHSEKMRLVRSERAQDASYFINIPINVYIYIWIYNYTYTDTHTYTFTYTYAYTYAFIYSRVGHIYKTETITLSQYKIT